MIVSAVWCVWTLTNIRKEFKRIEDLNQEEEAEVPYIAVEAEAAARRITLL